MLMLMLKKTMDKLTRIAHDIGVAEGKAIGWVEGYQARDKEGDEKNYNKGYIKGFELGLKTAKAEANHKGFITGSKLAPNVQYQIEQIAKEDARRHGDDGQTVY